MFSLAVAVCVGCEESLTENDTTEVPTLFVDGVPEIDPLDDPIESPDGSPAALNV